MKTETKSLSPAVKALCYQLLETELGGVQVYENALENIHNADLREEFEKYLGETRRHVEIARSILEKLGLDPDAEVPARVPVRTIGEGLVAAMIAARKGGTREEAELTAVECVVEAETKDHMNWGLCKMLSEKTDGELAAALADACAEVEKQEDHHYYHSQGWARELWIAALGLPPALPPPEEKRQVETAIGAERAKNARDEYTDGGADE
jgi:rubrerythrin